MTSNLPPVKRNGSGALLNQAEDWAWFQQLEPDPRDIGEQFKRAEEAIERLLVLMAQNGVPFEQVYCPVTQTKNLVFPAELLGTYGIQTMLSDAGYRERAIPEPTDKQQSLELRDAIMQGAQLNKKWH